jgi:hypothetical protein
MITAAAGLLFNIEISIDSLFIASYQQGIETYLPLMHLMGGPGGYDQPRNISKDKMKGK